MNIVSEEVRCIERAPTGLPTRHNPFIAVEPRLLVNRMSCALWFLLH